MSLRKPVLVADNAKIAEAIAERRKTLVRDQLRSRNSDTADILQEAIDELFHVEDAAEMFAALMDMPETIDGKLKDKAYYADVLQGLGVDAMLRATGEE